MTPRTRTARVGERRQRPTPSLPMLALLLALSSITPANAEQGFGLRLLFVDVDPGDGFELVDGPERLALEPDSETGWTLGFDYFPSQRFGVEVAATQVDLPIETTVDILELGGFAADRGDLEVTVASVGLAIDLLAGRRAALVLTPFVAWIDPGDLPVTLQAVDIVDTLRFDREIGWGLRLRASLPIGERWSIELLAERTDASIEATNEDLDFDLDFDLDPLILGAGVALRF